MSRLETRTRPILMPLIRGNSHRLSTFDQKTLASWIAKTIMVAEFLFPERVTVSDVDRLRMYASVEPSQNWRIWIAGYQGLKWRNLALGYHACAYDPSAAKSAESGQKIPADTQMSNIGMGRLFIHAISTTTAADFDFYERTYFRQIWPPSGGDIHWPLFLQLGSDQADYVAGTLARITGIPR